MNTHPEGLHHILKNRRSESIFLFREMLVERTLCVYLLQISNTVMCELNSNTYYISSQSESALRIDPEWKVAVRLLH
jgi:hypothetical protein